MSHRDNSGHQGTQPSFLPSLLTSFLTYYNVRPYRYPKKSIGLKNSWVSRFEVWNPRGNYPVIHSFRCMIQNGLVYDSDGIIVPKPAWSDSTWARQAPIHPSMIPLIPSDHDDTDPCRVFHHSNPEAEHLYIVITYTSHQ